MEGQGNKLTLMSLDPLPGSTSPTAAAGERDPELPDASSARTGSATLPAERMRASGEPMDFPDARMSFKPLDRSRYPSSTAPVTLNPFRSTLAETILHGTYLSFETRATRTVPASAPLRRSSRILPSKSATTILLP